MLIYNKKSQKIQRQHLRNNMTKAEKILWKNIRRRQMSGLKFRRQFGVEDYILDFFCPELKFAIEVDGDVHDFKGKRESSLLRDQALDNLGIKLVHYTNPDIFSNINGVLEHLLLQIEIRLKENKN